MSALAIYSLIESRARDCWFSSIRCDNNLADRSSRFNEIVAALMFGPPTMRQSPIYSSNKKIASIPWKSKPSWYILTTQDHTVHPDLQRGLGAHGSDRSRGGKQLRSDAL